MVLISDYMWSGPAGEPRPSRPADDTDTDDAGQTGDEVSKQNTYKQARWVYYELTRMLTSDFCRMDWAKHCQKTQITLNLELANDISYRAQIHPYHYLSLKGLSLPKFE